jgi:predicted glycoside hydrolase/deacetylase ChbG (UPF0249 family)
MNQGFFAMSNKKFILNADDFGMSKEHNKAVLNGYNYGFLTSASLTANGKEFNAAVNEILPECPDLGLGVHLNIIEGFALTDKKRFNKGWLQLWAKSGDEKFLACVEKEFRAQINQVRKYAKIDHLDSHVHVHAIPAYFKITARLAKEYGIPFVRTQHEEPYFVPDLVKHLNIKYPPNLLKVALLNSFTAKNKSVLKQMGLRTNDYIIGVGYTGMMDEKTVRYGLEAIEDGRIVETLIHPRYGNAEFKLTQNKELQHAIKQMGFDFTNYKSI